VDFNRDSFGSLMMPDFRLGPNMSRHGCLQQSLAANRVLDARL